MTWESLRRYVPILGVGMLAACQPRVDGSTDEAMQASIEKMKAGLSEEDQKKLQEALSLIAFEDAAQMNLLQLAANADQIVLKAKEKLNGKTFDGIMREADRIRAKRAAKEREQALGEINELKGKKASSEKAAAELSKFVVEKSRFYFKKDHFRHKPIIDLTVRNNTAHPVARAYFAGIIATPGRAVPWLKERFSYEIPGGLEPGEQARWRLEPNMFSDWGKVQWKDDMVFTVDVFRLDGADGQPLFSADFSEDDAKRLDALRAKYQPPLSQ